MKKIVIGILFLFVSINVFSQNIKELEAKYKENTEKGNVAQSIVYLNKIAYYYWNNDNYSKAASNFEVLVKLIQKQGNITGVRNVYSNLGLVYSDLEQYDKALSSFEKALEIAKQQGNKSALAAGYSNIAVVYQTTKKYKEAVNYVLKSFELAKELNNLKLIRSCYGTLAELYKKLGNSELTMKYFNLYSTFDKHIKEQEFEKIKENTQEVVRQVSAEKQKTENELKQEKQYRKVTQDSLNKVVKLTREQKLQLQLQDAKFKQTQAQLRTERMIRYFILGITAIIILFAFFIYKQVKATRKANKELAARNIEIKKQKDEIQKQSEKIRSSIQYAKRIQTAVLPPESQFEKYLNEYFVLFKPRDIVSGDFYWMSEKDNKLIIAAADCTGHGVPGAFMSMLGIAFLNEIVNKIVENKHVKSLHASEILNQLREYVIQSLHQKGSIHEAKDGMDISLVIIDKVNNEIQFAGAHNPLILIRKNEIFEVKADPIPIGYSKENEEEFTNNSMSFYPDDIIYMFSDGYPDQFGGANGRKFMIKRFKRMLLEISKYSLDKQRHILDRTIMEWKKGYNQIDDIMVLGIKMDFKQAKSEVHSAFNWSNKTVLIAEDTEANYLFLVEALRKTKVKIIRARNGKEAVDLVETKPEIDLVLMDVNMPVMDGFEATELIKEKRRKLPVIAQTALNISDIENRAQKVGCDDIIYKPIKLKLFLKILDKYLKI